MTPIILGTFKDNGRRDYSQVVCHVYEYRQTTKFNIYIIEN